MACGGPNEAGDSPITFKDNYRLGGTMTDRRKKQESNANSRSDNTEMDVLPAGRRRLLNALGKGSLAALPVLWARPIVQSTILPAHAQSSAPSEPECVIGVTWANTSTQDPVCLQFDDSEVGCVAGGTETYSESLPAGTYSIAFAWTSATGGSQGSSQDFSYTISCCNDGPLTGDAVVFPSNSGNLAINVAAIEVDDAGECTILVN